MFSSISKVFLLQKSLTVSPVSIAALSRSFSAVALNTISYALFIHIDSFRDNRGTNKPKRRVGRGNAAGQGTTAGKGKHGQNSRSGPISFC